MSKLHPLCIYCSKKIAKRTQWVRLTLKRTKYEIDTNFVRYIEVDHFPTNKAECQKLTNRPITSVKYADRYGAADSQHVIDEFYEWDGENYVDQYFCSGDHAKAFGYLVAREGRVTATYNAARMRQLEAKHELETGSNS